MCILGVICIRLRLGYAQDFKAQGFRDAILGDEYKYSLNLLNYFFSAQTVQLRLALHEIYSKQDNGNENNLII